MLVGQCHTAAFFTILTTLHLDIESTSSNRYFLLYSPHKSQRTCYIHERRSPLKSAVDGLPVDSLSSVSGIVLSTKSKACENSSNLALCNPELPSMAWRLTYRLHHLHLLWPYSFGGPSAHHWRFWGCCRLCLVCPLFPVCLVSEGVGARLSTTLSVNLCKGLVSFFLSLIYSQGPSLRINM